MIAFLLIPREPKPALDLMDRRTYKQPNAYEDRPRFRTSVHNRSEQVEDANPSHALSYSEGFLVHSWFLVGSHLWSLGQKMRAKLSIYSLLFWTLSLGGSAIADEQAEQEELAKYTIPVPKKFIDYVQLVETEKRDLRKILEIGKIHLFPSARIGYSAETSSISGELSHSEAMAIVKLSNLLTKMSPQDIFEHFLDEELTREITQ